jgi:uncharacterized protein YcbX
MGVVAELWRYPFKSMVGERVRAADMTERGLPGDRAWACRDEEKGGIRGAKQLGALMLLSACYEDGDTAAPPVIRLPDGTSFPADAPEAAERISAAIGRRVTVWPLQPATDLDHYRRGRPFHHDDRREDARAVFGLDADDPFPDFHRTPADVWRLLKEFESPPGTYFDAYPLLLLTRQSLQGLARRAPGSTVDVRRFRPNLLIDAPDADAEFPELAWVGRRLRAGGAELDVIEPCMRCVMISRPTDDLPGDRDMQKVVVRQLDHTMGVYARVVQPGHVNEGDPVDVLH